MFQRDRVIAYPPSPIDTNVRLFVQECDIVFAPLIPNEFQLIEQLLIVVWLGARRLKFG